MLPDSYICIIYLYMHLIMLHYLLMLQHDVDGKTYYTFEFVAKAPNFTRHALSAICIGNGNLHNVFTNKFIRLRRLFVNKLFVTALEYSIV